MPLPKLNIPAPAKTGSQSPIEIFNSSATTLRGRIQNLWEPQGEALRKWEELRTEQDVVINMSTGGGKTLVGLLIGQSILNETGRKVLYVCPTNQLAEQVCKFASETGLKTARYTSRGWENEDVYRHGEGCCVTSYASVFNSRSRFRTDQLAAVIFDDAHVAHNALRSQFTLTVRRNDQAYQEILDLFVPYLESVRKHSSIENLESGKPNQLVYIPLFISSEKEAQMQRIFESLVEREAEAVKKDPSKKEQTKFAFGFLENHLRFCSVVLSSDRIEVAPPLLPIRTLKYFDNARRVYLTATMPSGVEFIRLFGASNAKTIAPSGKLGSAQRLLISSKGGNSDEHRAFVSNLIKPYKACVIVPSNKAASEWPSSYEKFEGSRGNDGILRFSADKRPAKLVLVARFDGIDLPGDACRVLVLDGLPMGAFLFEKFLDQGIRINRVRAANISARIIQAMGRIFRSNTDHGAIVLCGKDIQEWVEDTDNRVYFPPLLQQQIQFSIQLRKFIDKGEVTQKQLIEAVLAGEEEWDAQYNNYIPNAPIRRLEEETDWAEGVALHERTGFEKLWNSDYNGAQEEFESALAMVPLGEKSQRAWLLHLKGYSLYLGGDRNLAASVLDAAADMRAELGRLPIEDGIELIESDELLPDPNQVERFLARIPKDASTISQVQTMFSALKYGSDTDACEEALKGLGFYLGVHSYRPEVDEGTGPDVCWSNNSKKVAMGFECKTNKQSDGIYKKKEDIGQISDHVQYMRDRFKGDYDRQIFLVGRFLEVAAQANPPPGLKIIELESFQSLAEQLLRAISELSRPGDPTAFQAAKAFKKYRLLWPECVDRMESRLATDLRSGAQPDLPPVS